MKNYKFLVLFYLLIFLGCGVEYNFNSAKKVEEEGKNNEAVDKYRNITIKYPKSEYALYSQIAIAKIFYKQQDYKQAKEEYNNFIIKNSSNVRVEVNEEIKKIDDILKYLEDGDEYLIKNQMELAENSFSKALEMDPNCQQAKQGLARVASKKEEINNLKKALEKNIFQPCDAMTRKDLIDKHYWTTLFTIESKEVRGSTWLDSGWISIYEGKNIELVNVNGTSDIEIVVKICEGNVGWFNEDFFYDYGKKEKKINWYRYIFGDWLDIPALQGKISKVIFELYRLKVKEEKVDAYGNVIAPREYHARRIKVIEIRKTSETDKINWGDISEDNLEKIVNKSIKMYKKPGEWFEVK